MPAAPGSHPAGRSELSPEDASQFLEWLVVIEHRRRHAIGGRDLQAPPQIFGVSGLVPHGPDSGLPAFRS
jgi:hypothetical protein